LALAVVRDLRGRRPPATEEELAEFGGGASVEGQVLEGRMPQLVERPAGAVRVEGGGGLLEQVLGARVG
jgi:hypothetical protein